MSSEEFIYSIRNAEQIILTFFGEDSENYSKFLEAMFFIKHEQPNVIIRGKEKHILGVAMPGYRYTMYVVPSRRGFLIKFQQSEAVPLNDCSVDWLQSMAIETAEIMAGNYRYKLKGKKLSMPETTDERIVRLLLSIESLRTGLNPETGAKLPHDNIIFTDTLESLLDYAEKALLHEQNKFAKKSGLKYGEWTKLEDDLLRGLIKEGYTSGDIASKLHRSQIDEYYRRKHLGMVNEPKPEFEDEFSEISDKELLELINTPIESTKPTCDKCKIYVAENCGGLGNPLACSDFDPVPSVTPEEKEMWPKYGMATFIKLKNSNDGHNEL